MGFEKDYLRSGVYIVGAGPGHADLLTLQAKRILEHADVVLYDYLVHPSILALVPIQSHLVCVGKQKDKHSKTQVEINQLILDYSKKHTFVVRLKGGDPVIFGRLGEEVDFLEKHGLFYQVVPGVSSATAGPTYVGIPLTHRMYSKSVAFVTGTTKTSEALSQKELPVADTLVVMMALSQLNLLLKRLVNLGKFHDKTPVALISYATLANQDCLKSNLENLEQDLKSHPMSSPCLMVVGDVVGIKREQDYFVRWPLSGKRIWLFQENQRVEPLEKSLLFLGADVIHQPLIYQKKLPVQEMFSEDLNQSDWLVFTSPVAVELFFEELLNQQIDVRTLQDKKIAVIGLKTAEVLKEKGFFVDFMPRETANQEAMLADFCKYLKGLRVFLAQAKGARNVFENGLKERGATCFKHELYETKIKQKYQGRFASFSKKDILIFSSPSMLEAFQVHFKDEAKENLALAIGPITAQALKKAGFLRIVVSESASYEGIVSTLMGSFSK